MSFILVFHFLFLTSSHFFHTTTSLWCVLKHDHLVSVLQPAFYASCLCLHYHRYILKLTNYMCLHFGVFQQPCQCISSSTLPYIRKHNNDCVCNVKQTRTAAFPSLTMELYVALGNKLLTQKQWLRKPDDTAQKLSSSKDCLNMYTHTHT